MESTFSYLSTLVPELFNLLDTDIITISGVSVSYLDAIVVFSAMGIIFYIFEKIFLD